MRPGVQAVYGEAHETKPMREALRQEEPGKPLVLQEFIAHLKSGFPAFDMLQDVAAGN